VTPNRPWKSISCEETYARDLSDFQEMASELERMSGQLAASLSKKRLRARTVTIKVRYADFTTVTRSHTGEDSTNSEKYIAACARALLERTDAAHRPVRLLGVGAHGLEHEGDGHPESERLF
jgi:DNA polymerase-4